MNKNIFEMAEEERCAEGVCELPLSLAEAIAEMSKSSFIKDVLGDHIFSKYVEAKEAEFKEYSTRVSRWEIDSYLKKY